RLFEHLDRRDSEGGVARLVLADQAETQVGPSAPPRANMGNRWSRAVGADDGRLVGIAEVIVDLPQRRTTTLARVNDYLAGAAVAHAADRGSTMLDNAGFFARDFDGGAAQHLRVIEADAGDERGQRAAHV